LVGEAIPLAARIIAVADAYLTITRHRPYQQARTRVEALAEIRRCSGTQFDPSIVETFGRLLVETPPLRLVG
jgi:HD-GYP domain-containing protein (c-di-GMP phosphodiesterase class II)